jgi:hypothetical protein
MMTLDDRPTTAELYSKAINSSHLECTDKRGDVDRLIAAGWVSNTLATMLYRLRVEYEATDASMKVTKTTQDGDRIIKQVQVLMSLNSLHTTKEALGNHAIRQATRRRFMRPDNEVDIITGKVLEHWLSPNCHHCSGRGFSGGFDGPKILCTKCQGSGKRTLHFKTEAESDFGRWLLSDMERMMANVETEMRRFLRMG